MQAQVGVGTVTPNAQLEIASSNQANPANTDGIIIPKINTFPATSPTASQQGMLVYLTTTVGANTPGFYFWDNSATTWIGIKTTANADWNILGNSGTNTATNFFGTTDDKDIIFKRNNIRAGFIGNPNTASGNKNTSFGANALNAATLGTRNTAVGTNVLPSNTTGNINVAVGEQTMFTNTTGSENVAVGVGALYTNLTGSFNTAIGRNAMTSNSSGGSNTALGYASLLNNANSFNTAIGRDALRTNTSGSENTAAGVNALYANVSGIGNAAYGVKSLRNTTGSYNVGNGYESLFTNGSGNNNIGIGYQSMYSNVTGNNNIAIGYQAGYSETGSNRLYIENSNADASNALIYGEFDNNILRANGTMQIGNPATTGYALPTARGTNGQVLQTDGAGATTWANPQSNLSVMRSNLGANQSLGTGGWQLLNFNTVVFDLNTEFNTGTSRFVATKTGYYEVNAGYHTDNQSNTQFYSIGVRKNGAFYQQTTGNHSGTGPVCRNINCIVALTAGDYIEIYAENYQSGVNVDAYSGKTFFEVKQIR